jgi:hypothetical protein
LLNSDSKPKVRPTAYNPKYLVDQVWVYKDYQDSLPPATEILGEAAVSCWMACNGKWFFVFQRVPNALPKIWKIGGDVVRDAAGLWAYRTWDQPEKHQVRTSTAHGLLSIQGFVCQRAVGTAQAESGEGFFPLAIHFTRQGSTIHHPAIMSEAVYNAVMSFNKHDTNNCVLQAGLCKCTHLVIICNPAGHQARNTQTLAIMGWAWCGWTASHHTSMIR